MAALDLADNAGGATVGLSQAGASQVLSSTAGIEKPILVNCLFRSTKVYTRNADDIIALLSLCLAMVLSYLLLTLAFARRAPVFKLRWLWRCLPERMALRPRSQALLNRSHGIALVLLCVIFYSLSIIDSEIHDYAGVSQWG
uniref:Uncharacterized protein n=1 Tax=Aureoumbra lagunensis TaxID=44058 RepID=A0A7S3K641_9STRA|mmetsp:Transcript_4077/g.5725  ORF Transcript_4077/g.5725 Transcript_4077/m.5725 type:complete len:142 (+) Transcript_4077:528-953(+)